MNGDIWCNRRVHENKPYTINNLQQVLRCSNVCEDHEQLPNVFEDDCR